MIIRCRHRIPSPEAVGFLTVEGLREAAAQYPHLRPCPKQGCHWLYRTACAKCVDKLEVPLEGSAREHEKGTHRPSRWFFICACKALLPAAP